MSIASCRRNQRALRLQDALEAAESAENAVSRMARVNCTPFCLRNYGRRT